MSRCLKARLSKLEASCRPKTVQNNVVTIDAKTRHVIGRLPKTKSVMIMVDHGTDDEWQAALMEQQARLSSVQDS